MRKLLPVIFLLMILAALTGCNKKSSAKQQTVNIAIQPSAAFIPLYIARYKGFIDEALKPMKVKVVWQDFECFEVISLNE